VIAFLTRRKAADISFSLYVVLCAILEFFMMVADVSADGYIVELSQQEAPEKRGNILTTSQIIKFSVCVAGSMWQSLLLNGPTTNAPHKGFAWGLTISQSTLALLAVVSIFLIPTLWMFKERRFSKHEPESIMKHFGECWHILHNTCLFSVIIWAGIFIVFAGASNNVGAYVIEGEIIKMSELQFGVDNAMSNLVVAIGIWFFKRYLKNVNWRLTQVWTGCLIAVLNLGWLIPIHCKTGFCRSPWFCICLDGVESMVNGCTFMLVGMAAVEMAPKGFEATTYELLASTSNGYVLVNNVVGTALMAPFQLAETTADNETPETDMNMQNYTLIISAMNIGGMLAAIWFFPTGRAMCHEWKEKGGHRLRVAVASFTLVAFTTIYSIVASILGVIPATACLQIVGGDGCGGNSGDYGYG